MAWGVTYFDQIILSMSSLQATYHNIRAANGVRSPPLESHEVHEEEFEYNPQVKPMHKAIKQYMHMVGVMCLYSYIRDAQTANPALHLSALAEFIKYFFALDKLSYAKMIPIYLAEMSQLERTYPEIWSEAMEIGLQLKTPFPFVL